MLRLLVLFLTAAISAAPAAAQNAAGSKAAPAKPGIDKAALESYVRHLWVLGQEYQVAISDPKASAELPGFSGVTVRISEGAATQDVTLWVSPDGSKIIQGSVYDLKHNPFKKELDAIKTAFHPSMGTPGASVVLVEFSDMQCPHCKRQHDMLAENLLKTYPKEVRFYFKDFPLTTHSWAKPAAIAGRCVFNQKPDAFWSYLDWVFGRQESITPDSLKANVMEWAKSRQGIEAQQLGKCMEEKATEADIDADLAEGRVVGVDSTPALFVNGRRVSASTDWGTLKRVIDLEIKYQEVARNAGENCGCEVTLNVPGLPSKASPVAPPGANR